jgi:hypothetical protein
MSVKSRRALGGGAGAKTLPEYLAAGSILTESIRHIGVDVS